MDEQPTPKRLRLPDQGGSYMRTIEVNEGVFTVITRLMFNKSIYQPRYYRELRQFYADVVAAEAEFVVLRKSTEAVGDH